MSFKPEVKINNRWQANSVAFVTREEAEIYVDRHAIKGMGVDEVRVVFSDEPPTYYLGDNGLIPLAPPECRGGHCG